MVIMSFKLRWDAATFVRRGGGEFPTGGAIRRFNLPEDGRRGGRAGREHGCHRYRRGGAGGHPTAYSSLVDLSSDTSRGFVVGQLGDSTNQYQLWFMDAAQSGWYPSPAAGTVAGQVNVLSVVKNGTSAASYLNGLSQGASTVPAAMLTPTTALAVGNRASGNCGYNGQIAEILVYNRALSDDERLAIEAALRRSISTR